jgi:protein-disulfide isomerase
MSKKKSKKESSDEIVVSLDQFAVPGAIILAGVIIAVAVFVTNRNNTDTVDTNDTEGVAGEETASEDDSEFQSASVSIGDVPSIGDEDSARVAIVEFNEYKCGYCLRHKDETLPSIIEEYVNTGKIIYVFKEFPIYGDDAANAAKCVYHIDGIEEYQKFHNKAFNYESDNDLYDIASEIGVNNEKFDSCYSSREYQGEVDADLAEGQNIGIQGTPGFVVGTIENGQVTGVLVPGAYPLDTFSGLIDGYLSE